MILFICMVLVVDYLHNVLVCMTTGVNFFFGNSHSIFGKQILASVVNVLGF
jgi:hypothetical protein